MGGFQFNGCGAKDYFTKIKYLGDQLCPYCKKIAPFYLEKGKFKISVIWIPTITLKERYAIMCEKCKEGRWIEDSEAYSILNNNTNVQEVLSDYYQYGIKKESEEAANHDLSNTDNVILDSMEKKICSKCGSEVYGTFCSVCGTKYSKNSVNESASVKLCSKCGAEVTGAFCGMCGTKYLSEENSTTINEEQHKLICSNCGAEMEGDFCGRCGKKNQKNLDASNKANKESDRKQFTQEWECSLCGTKNPENSNKCSLCGCTKNEN